MQIVISEPKSDNNKNNLFNRFIFVLTDEEIKEILSGVGEPMLTATVKHYANIDVKTNDCAFAGFFLGRSGK